jgi:phospholipid/cholesterol/gamma-HCH transport system permease protein
MNVAIRGFEEIGRRSAGFFDQIGYGATLFAESIYWLLAGWRRRQPVRMRLIFHEMHHIGVAALRLASLL